MSKKRSLTAKGVFRRYKKEDRLPLWFGFRLDSVDCRNIENETPLHTAAWRESSEEAAALLDAGADPNALSEFKITPLRIAASNGKLDLVELLVSYGAKDNTIDDFGLNARNAALKSGHSSVYAFLVSKFGKPDPPSKSKIP